MFVGSLDANITGIALVFYGFFVNQWGAWLAGLIELNHKRHGFVFRPDQAHRFLCDSHRFGGNGGDRLAGIAQQRQFVAAKAVFLFRFVPLYDDPENPRVFAGCRHIERFDAGVGVRRVQEPAIKHPGQLDVGRIFCGAGHFLEGVHPFDALAHYAKLFVDGQGGRFIGCGLSFDLG